MMKPEHLKSSPQQELLSLVSSLVDGSIDESDQLRLAELLCNDERRKLYLQYCDLHTDLFLQSGQSVQPVWPAGSSAAAALSPRRPWVGRVAILALVYVACMTIAALTLYALQQKNRQPAIAGKPVEEQAVGYAVITGQANAVWDDGMVIKNGTLIPEGKLKLNSGIVQLELFSGVSVIIEGSAEFAIESPMEMSVIRGRLRAHVPEPARGFVLRTNEGKLVDLGTEFAIDASLGKSDIHVLDGEVEWQPNSTTSPDDSANAAQRIFQGQAMRWTPDGLGIDLETTSQKFLGTVELRDKLSAARESKRIRWQQFCESLQDDPRLLAWFQTGATEAWSRRLPNLADAGAFAAGDGAVVAAARTTDRWGRAEHALDFSPTGSRVRLSVTGSHSALTLCCWVRINSLDRWYNSLFLTDGHDLHEPHWQIMDDGRLFFSVKKRDKFDHRKGELAKHIFYSPPFWNATLSGQWLMITTVYNPTEKVVTHYLNGETLSEELIPDEYLVEQISIGNASLCNWGLPELGWIAGQPDESRFAVRNLNGSMDEFVLFNAALPANEIREMYEYGKP